MTGLSDDGFLKEGTPEFDSDHFLGSGPGDPPPKKRALCCLRCRHGDVSLDDLPPDLRDEVLATSDDAS